MKKILLPILTVFVIGNFSLADEILHLDARCYVPFKDLLGATKAEDAADVLDAKVIAEKKLQWKASETAIVICDMWNQHWCQGATSRVAEMATRMNECIANARKRGVTIIHAPSETMDFYKDHRAYLRAQTVPNADNAPKDINKGKSAGSEEKKVYPIDQSDAGCDCAVKCRVRFPWKCQIADIEIDEEKDYISDSGGVIWNIFEHKGLKNVMLCGVHTNMCVIGRPFGLRNMARFGRNTVLIRDLTDTMYNSRMKPYVNHFTGTDLIIRHIEKMVCPTITSTIFTGKEQFVFKNDRRLRINFIVSESEYRSHLMLPRWAEQLQLKSDFACDFSIGLPNIDGPGRHDICGLENLRQADIAVMMIRRRALEDFKIDYIKEFLKSRKPLLAIRTASHAFDAKRTVPREGGTVVTTGAKVSDVLTQWPEFDKDVLGGNYQGHYGHNPEGTDVTIVPGMEGHPIMAGISAESFNSKSWLYKNRPLRSSSVQVLLLGQIPNKSPEPVLWTHRYRNSKIVYTSLGHWDDWKIPAFQAMMDNSLLWLLGKQPPQ